MALESGKFRPETLKSNRFKATGLMFEPSDLTASPPKAPAIPPNNLPIAAGDLSSVRGGSVRPAEQAVARLTRSRTICLARPLIRREEEQLLLLDRPAEGKPELILLKNRTPLPGSIAKKVACVESFIPEKLKYRSVKRISTRLGNHTDVGAGIAPVTSIVESGLNLELLQTIGIW